MEPMTREEWAQIEARLQAPFLPKDVHFRIQGTPKQQEGKLRGQVVAYIDARTVQDRLDRVVGSENWSFTWDAVAVVNGVVKVAKGRLSLYGRPPKEDVGDSGDIEATKSAVSDALKRSAVQWGVGRYLYDLPSEFVEVEQQGEKNWRIPKAVVQRLRASLPRPEGTPAAASTEIRSGAQPAQPSQAAAPRMAAAAPQPHAPASVPAQAKGEPSADDKQPANEQQMASIRKLCAALGREEPDPKRLTVAGASALIKQMSRDYNNSRKQPVLEGRPLALPTQAH